LVRESKKKQWQANDEEKTDKKPVLTSGTSVKNTIYKDLLIARDVELCLLFR
jgi:hypothetical protein